MLLYSAGSGNREFALLLFLVLLTSALNKQTKPAFANILIQIAFVTIREMRC